MAGVILLNTNDCEFTSGFETLQFVTLIELHF